MTKIHILESEAEKLVLVHCPGCKMAHPFRVRGKPGQPVWRWDGSESAPTFSPSMLVNQHHEPARCHSFVRNGEIQFLGDCHHELKGQTVPLPDFPKD